jgi:hypothetical protein
MSYRTGLLALWLAIAIGGCASKRTYEEIQRDLERAEINKVLEKAKATDLPNLQRCQGLVIDLEGKPVGENVVRGVGHVIGYVVLIPVLMIVSVPLYTIGVRGNYPDPFDGPGLSDAVANSRTNALARDRITARCVVATSTEQTVGPDHIHMALPLVRLAEAYQLAGIDAKGPAARQGYRLFERALSLMEAQQDQVEKDDEYAKQLDSALEWYVRLLVLLKRDPQAICPRLERVRGNSICTPS